MEETEFYKELRLITERSDWVAKSIQFIESAPLDAESRTVFHTFWTVCGHHLRAQIANDEILVKFLRVMFPICSFPEVTLYRGENLDRWNAGRVGLCWTTDRNIADMFARGLNATQSGGVTIKGLFSGSAILAGPSPHSIYLGEEEYTVDTSGFENFEIIQLFPKVD